MAASPESIEGDRFARAIAASKRIRWDIDKDVIRERVFETTQKFLPDGLTKIDQFDFLTPEEKKYLSQIQGRTYANVFGLVERFVNALVLTLSRDHFFGNQAALEALTRIAAVEFGPLGIRCNAVGPGIIPTEGTLSHYGDETTRLRRGRALPAGRYGDPGDVADVVAFFCSDDSRYVTGQVIYVDGGYTAAGAHFFRLGRDAEARHAGSS